MRNSEETISDKTSNKSLNDYRFLVIGCGSIGRRHLANLRRLGARNLFAFDVLEDRRIKISKEFHATVSSDLDKAIREVNVALICTPPNMHVAQALTAVKNGCHLFIEKPISDTLDGLDDLIGIADRMGLSTLVGCNYRFHPGLRQVKSLLASNELGKVVSARAQFGQYLPDWHPWEDYRTGYSAHKSMGGGIVLDRIHEIDYMRWFFGEIVEVCSIIDHRGDLDIDTEDIAEIILRFAQGTIGSIHLDYLRRTYSCTLDIVAQGGIIQWSYGDRQVRWYSSNDECWHTINWPNYDQNEMYLEELRHFIRALNSQEEAEVDLAEGKRDLQIALAAKESSQLRRAITV